MKTIVTIAACTVFGLTSMVSFASERKSAGMEQKTETLTEQSGLIFDNSFAEMEAYTAEGSASFVDQYAGKQLLALEMEAEGDFLNEAGMVTAEGSSLETEKYADMQLLAIELDAEEADFLNTAAQLTAETAKLEAAKYANMQLSALK
jgi:hypothetical protein